MDRLTAFLGSVRPTLDGDFVDRLNSFYTIAVLFVSAALVSGWSFIGSPIQCWFPAYFKGWWMQYSLDYCFVQNTYFVPFTNHTPARNYWDLVKSHVDLPTSIEDRESRLIGYYQWVPFILVLIALCFYFPMVIWRSLNKHSGISVKTICDMTTILQHVDAEPRRANTRKVARLIDQSKLLSEELYGQSVRQGRYVSTLYLIVKALYLLNSIAQFFLLKTFLGASDHMWGLRVTKNLMDGVQWEETGHFPRVTVCDFEVREMGNLHRHSVQCVLMINMFNEKIFLILWWLFAILMPINAIDLVLWAAAILIEPLNVSLVRDYLGTLSHPKMTPKEVEMNMLQFIRTSLKTDGVFLLRLISCNAGDAVSRDMVEYLWLHFLSRRRGRAPLAADTESPAATVPYESSNPDDTTLPLDNGFGSDEQESRENAKESTL